MFNWLKELLGRTTSTGPQPISQPIPLNPISEDDLRVELRMLPQGGEGYITYDHFKLLFATIDEDPEWDEEGMKNAGVFFASERFMPRNVKAERRIYVKRSV